MAAFAPALIYGTPVIGRIREQHGADPDGIVRALADELRQELGQSPREMTSQAIICSAAKRT